MAVTGPFAELSRTRELLQAAAKGETVRTIGAALRSTAFGLAARGWDARESPRGTPWRPAKNGVSGGL